MSKAAVKASTYDVIRSPLITEKSTILGELNKYSFKIAPSATKKQVKEAVEAIFEVEVKKVNVLNVKGKVKRFRGRIGKRSGYRKAIVTLPEGKTIDVLGGA